MNSAADVIRSLASGTRAGLIMDFDGVLSPIIDDPHASELLGGTAELLERLASRLEVVALLSGRPAAFLAERVRVSGVQLHGSYGLERWVDDGSQVIPEAEVWLPAVAAATAALREELGGLDGVLVEEKTLGVGVHWRRAADRDAAAALIEPIVSRVAHETGLHREPGKLVDELRMPLPHDKGTALRAIVAEGALDAVAYAGDDRGDLPAFAAVADFGGAALVVDSAEIAPEVAAVAGVHFGGPRELQAWLGELADALG